MFYFGRIIGAFFNQLFRFLFWNKFGQKILIAIIICLIAFWCVGMTEVHAVEEVEDVNIDFQQKYENIINDTILRLWQNMSTIKAQDYWYSQLIDSNNIPIFYYSSNTTNDYGLGFSGGSPLNNRFLHLLVVPRTATFTRTAQNTDWDGITGYSFYKYDSNYNFLSFNFTSGSLTNVNTNNYFYTCNQAFLYNSSNWLKFIDGLRNNNSQQIQQLLEDIKAEQQATNDFLTEEQDDSLMDIQTPTYTDSASENMSTNLHDSINSLTTQMQTTVSNYYEGWDAYSWVIPLPQYIGGNITFDSGVTRKIIGSSGVLYNLIQAVWVILFGGYIIGFIKRMLDWVQTGKIFDEGGLADFIWWMDTNNEIIKASMM